MTGRCVRRRWLVNAYAAVHVAGCVVLVCAATLALLGDEPTAARLGLAVGLANVAVGAPVVLAARGHACVAVAVATVVGLLQPVGLMNVGWPMAAACTVLLAVICLATVDRARAWVDATPRVRPGLAAGVHQAAVLAVLPLLSAPLLAVLGQASALTLATVGAGLPAVAWARAAVVTRAVAEAEERLSRRRRPRMPRHRVRGR